jgi:flagella basal body P-ring formation protein FlgA
MSNLPTIRSAAILLLLATASDRVDAVEIALREQAELQGPVVCLGDVAEIKAAPSEQADVTRLASQPLMPAPAPGETRYLRPSEVLRMLATSGHDVQTVQFTGAESVAIGGAAVERVAEPTNRAAARTIGTSVDAKVTAAITQYLREQTGHDQWNVRPELDRQAMNELLVSPPLQVAGGRAPWTGLQRFQIDDGSGQPTTVSARVERIQLVAFAVRPIERDALVGAADVELRPHAGAVPVQAVASLEAVVGKEATTAIRPGAMLMSNQLRAAVLVRRGERVSIRVRAAGVTVRTFATAQQDGAEGDLVMVESLANKERYTASVTGVRELEVFAARSTATDVADRTPADDPRLR